MDLYLGGGLIIGCIFLCKGMDLYLRGELISGVGAYNRMYFFCLQVDGPIS